VSCAAFAPDGARVASSGPDLAVRVWSLAPPRELLELRGPARPVVALAFSGAGRRLVAASMGGELFAWDAASGALLLEKRGPADGVLCVALDARGERLAWAGDGGTLRVWSGLDGKKLGGLRDASLGRVSALAFAPGAAIATAARFEASPPRVWELDELRLGAQLSPERGPVRAVAFDARGALCACALDDGRVQVFDAETGDVLLLLEGPPGTPSALAFDPRGERLFVGGPGALVQVWDAALERHAELREEAR
jgi:WD40 repeat protein